MPQSTKPETARIDLHVSLEAKIRFTSLHKSLGFKTRSETLEAILFYASTVDKIDPSILERMEHKLDRVAERLDDLL